MRRVWPALALTLLLAGCPQETPDDGAFAGLADAKGGAGALDGGGQPQDSGATPDGGAPADTAGAPDAGGPDTGMPDTGIPDTGVPDTGIPDTGGPDTGGPDTGAPADTAAAPDTSGCSEDDECDDGDPCTGNQCNAGTCEVIPLANWATCGPGKQCAPGQGCVATVRGSTLDVAVGDMTSCALVAGDTAWCWGRNDAAQLPLGKASGTAKGEPWPLPAALGKTSAIALGGGFGCALDSAGKIRCWGKNNYGQLGVGPGAPSNVAKPTPIQSTASFGALALSVSHGCAITTGGEVACWGIGAAGQLGDGKGSNSVTPVKAKGLASVEQLALGEAFSCARNTQGEVWCWGTNNEGQMGDGQGGTGNTVEVPQKVAALTGFVSDIAAGRDHVCALMSKEVWCWGNNEHAQIGSGKSSFPAKVPTKVWNLPFTPDELSLGGDTSCAWQLGGKLACWGSNSHGQLMAKGTNVPVKTPTELAGLVDLKELAMGESHACARIVGDQTACWGNNYSGQGGSGGGANNLTTPTLAGKPTP